MSDQQGKSGTSVAGNVWNPGTTGEHRDAGDSESTRVQPAIGGQAAPAQAARPSVVSAGPRSVSRRTRKARLRLSRIDPWSVMKTSLLFGVAGATSDSMAVLIAGAAGMVAGALSMGGGEYVSVSSQRDTEQAAGVAPEHRTSPWQAASASMVAFVLGALIPLLGVVFAPVPVRLPVTIAAVLLALAVTGFTSARLSGVPVNRPVLRNLVVGTLAMGLTYAAGTLVGTQL